MLLHSRRHHQPLVAPAPQAGEAAAVAAAVEVAAERAASWCHKHQIEQVHRSAPRTALYLYLQRVPVDAQPPVDHAGAIRGDERGEHVKVVRQAYLDDEPDACLHVPPRLQGQVARAAAIRAQQLDPPQACRDRWVQQVGGGRRRSLPWS